MKIDNVLYSIKIAQPLETAAPQFPNETHSTFEHTERTVARECKTELTYSLKQNLFGKLDFLS